MPNRVSHTFYYLNYKKTINDSKNPDDNGANAGIGEVLVEELSDML